MPTTTLIRTCSILGALVLGGCPSDGENATGSASATDGETDDDEDSDEDSDEDAGSNTQGSNSATQGGTETTTDSGPTSVDTTDTDPDTTATDPDTTATDPDTTDTDPSDTDPSSSGVTDSDSTSSSDGGSSEESSSSGAASVSVTDSDSDTVDPNCEAPGELISCDAAGNDPFQAIGLGCDGDANQVIPIDNTVFSSADGNAWRIASQFGTYIDPVTNEPLWGAREGERLLILSTGTVPQPNQQGVVTMGAGANQIGLDNGNPNDSGLPAPMSANDGGQGGPFVNCDGVGDCSNTIEAQWLFGGSAANDLLWMQFETQVPGGTNGFSFDFAYFSAEFPEWVNDPYNDIFLAWSASETYTGNLCFINDQPCTVTALCDSDDTCPGLAYCDDGPFGQCANAANGELAGTGFDGVGGGTGWFTAAGSAAPDETLQLTFAVFDMFDSIYDTAVLLDNWRWDCEGCVPSEVMGCGIEPTP